MTPLVLKICDLQTQALDLRQSVEMSQYYAENGRKDRQGRHKELAKEHAERMEETLKAVRELLG